MGTNSLIGDSISSDQAEQFGGRYRRYAWKGASVATVLAGALLWSGSQAADYGLATSSRAGLEAAHPPAPVYRSRLEEIAAQQGEAITPPSAPAVAVVDAPKAPVTAPIIKSEPAPSVQLASVEARAAKAQPAVLRTTLTPQVGGMALPAAAPNLFGSTALSVGSTPMDAKWRSVNRTSVGGVAGGVISQAKGESGYQQLQRVNTWVNRQIAFTDDFRTGPADHWSNAEDSLRRGVGDCEDYAIAKLQILRAAGFDTRDLYLVLVRDLVRRADHAILVARVDGRFFVLDSNTDRIVPTDAVQDYRPLMSFSGERSWIHGYRQEPAKVMLASNVAPAAGETAANTPAP